MSNCNEALVSVPIQVRTPAPENGNLIPASPRGPVSRSPSVSEAKTTTKLDKKKGLRIGFRWVAATGLGTFAANSFLNGVPIVSMIQAMAQSKLSMLSLSSSVAETLISAGTTVVSILGIYLTLTTLSGLWHVARRVMSFAYYTLYGIWTLTVGICGVIWTLVNGLIKNAGEISSVAAAIIFPAWAFYRYKSGEENNGWGAVGLLSIVINPGYLMIGGGIAVKNVVRGEDFDTSNQAMAIYFAVQALATLYTIGRYAKEKKDKANATTA